MSTLAALFRVAFQLVVALWNASFVFLQVIRSAMQEAKQEAAEVMALLDEDVPMMDAVTSTLPSDVSGSTRPWQMLIIARQSTFVLLVRLSKHRVLHLEVDERFITTKLEVIQTELMLHIQHIPRLLQVPIGMYDTQLVRYMPMKLPYVWKEEWTMPRCGDEGVGSIVPAAPASPVIARSEGRSRRKKFVMLIEESALRRRLHMDRLERVGLEATSTPKRGTGVVKNREELVVKRKALRNATNAGATQREGRTDGDGTSGERQARDVFVTPKQVRMERNIHAALSENLSIPNMMLQASSSSSLSLGKAAAEKVQPLLRRVGAASLRRKRGQFDLYAQGAPSEFSLLPKTGGD